MPAHREWTLLIPVKGGRRAKSRLARSLATSCSSISTHTAESARDAAERITADLATAFVHDVLTAARQSDRVSRIVVVTGDPQVQQAAQTLGLEWLPDSGHGLVAAISAATQALLPHRAAIPAQEGPVAVLLADVPAMQTQDLDTALEAAEGGLARGLPMVVLPDADRIGSILLAAASAGRLQPAFGPDSFQRHRAAGAHELELSLPRMQRDVDSADDLCVAIDLGCGPATTTVLDQICTRTTQPCRDVQG